MPKRTAEFYRSYRRQRKLAQEHISYIYGNTGGSLACTSSQESSDQYPQESSDQYPQIFESTHHSVLSSHDSIDSSHHSIDFSHHSIDSTPCTSLNSQMFKEYSCTAASDSQSSSQAVTHDDERLFVDDFYSDHHWVLSDSSDSSDSDTVSDSSLPDQLSSWASQNKIGTNALNALLIILRQYHSVLPKDGRTLMKTQTKYNIVSIGGGSYYHFGISKGVLHELMTSSQNLSDVQTVSLQVNIDGLPLFKSSGSQFWPILGRLISPYTSKPFMIGLFFGNEKPKDANEFLKDFVDEMGILQTSGIKVPGTGHTLLLELSCFLCDVPAKSFVKKIKGHSGYFGCDRCCQKGVYLENKVTFPASDAPLRTDVAFDEMEDNEHHKGSSVLKNLQIGMVTKFPLDYMHLVCLGVMRRLLFLWMKGPLLCRQGPGFIRRVNGRLAELQGYLPREFLRKGRSLNEIDRWKAVEFRQFLLYTGPVILKESLPGDLYSHFLLFFVSILCLSSPIFVGTYRQYAKQLLRNFVIEVGSLYGKGQYVYNIHGLVHLADDVSRYGHLDMFSAFPFESYLGKIKRLIRKPNFPLQQVIRRFSEEKGKRSDGDSYPDNGIVKKQHWNGPLLQNNRRMLQYEQLHLPSAFFSCRLGDNCILLSEQIGLIRNILSAGDNCEKLFLVEWFKDKEDFFSSPLPSSDLRIFRVRNLAERLSTVAVTNIVSKCVLMPYKDDFVAVPLIHHLTLG